MSSLSHQHRPHSQWFLEVGQPKNVNAETTPNPGSLSPEIQPQSPPVFPKPDNVADYSKIGNYILYQHPENADLMKAIHIGTQEEYICEVVSLDCYRDRLASYFRVDAHAHINHIHEILLGDTKAYCIFPPSHGHLHSYVREKRRLRELEAQRLFYQIVKAVDHCHDNGIILRDLKLRRFVFKDRERTEVKLESLDDACILDDSDDTLVEKHGCPVYVSPEILHSNVRYSGRAADVWSLGVMLYTMLVGRYPFHDADPSGLFSKIRRGQFTIPDSLSSRAKCLLRNLLRKDPIDRLTTSEILAHPWFTAQSQSRAFIRVCRDYKRDQTVPSCCQTNDDDETFVFSPQ